jgi:flagellar basal-body rod protein FlgF
MGLLEMGGVIISQATRRAEVAAQNMSNMTTPGFKAHRQSFEKIAADAQDVTASSARADDAGSIDFTVGKLQKTDNPFDLALVSNGFFAVQSDDGAMLYTRNGQFRRDTDGHLLTASGATLQSASGDLTVGPGDVTVMPDGTVTQNGQPVDRIAITDFDDPQVLHSVDGGLFAAPPGEGHDADNPRIRQGMLEASNVGTAEQMLSLMTATRSAEAGQRVVQVYDDLMGRAITTFGQAP